jgi:hypothetical protein
MRLRYVLALSAAGLLATPWFATAGTTGSPGPNQLYGHISSNRTLTVASPGPNYEIIGDLTIDPGVTLTIERGTTLSVTPTSDFLASGADRGRVEILVQGTLLVPPGAGLVQLLCNQGLGWVGITVASGGIASLSDCTIAQALLGMSVESGGTLIATHCDVLDVLSGLRTMAGASAHVVGCHFYGRGDLSTSIGISLARSLTPMDSLAPQPNRVTNFQTGINTEGPGIVIEHVLVESCRYCILVDEPDATLNYCTAFGALESAVRIGDFPTTRIYNSIIQNVLPVYSESPSVYCNYSNVRGFGQGDPFGGIQLGNQNASFDPFFESNFDLSPASLFTNYSVSGGKIGAYGPGPVLPTPVMGASVVDSEGSGGVVRVRWLAEARGESKAGIFRRSEEGSWKPLTVLYPDGRGYLVLEDRDVQAGERYGYGVGVQRDSHVGIEGEVWVRVEAPISGLSIRSVAPNPATTAWSIGFVSPATSEAVLEAIDLGGRVVRTVKLGALASGEQAFSLPAQGLPQGVYWIRVREGSRSTLFKAVKAN